MSKETPPGAPTSLSRKGTCPICQSKVLFPSRLSHVWRNQLSVERADYKEGRTSRAYVDAFLASPHYDTLCRIEHHGINNARHLRKEITETYAVLRVLQRQHHISLDLDKTFLVDLCSGKSLTTSIFRLLYPNGSFIAVDILPTNHIPHYIEYWREDIRSESFEKRLYSRILTEKDKNVVLVGMHLCGGLAEDAIDLFASHERIEGLLLCPCCLPSIPPKKDERRRVSFRREKDESDEPNGAIQDWIDHLYSLLTQIEGVTVERYRDEDMHSERNSILWATRLARE